MGAEREDTVVPFSSLPNESLSGDPSEWSAKEYAQIWGSGMVLDANLPLFPIQGLLFAVGMLRRLDDPAVLQEQLPELYDTLSELSDWGQRAGALEHLKAFENRRSFAAEAAVHVRAWGCEIHDGEVKISSEGAGRPVDVFTVAVGLLWEREERHYTEYAPEELCRSLLDVLRVFWPARTWQDVQYAANRFREAREKAREKGETCTYDRAFGRLTPPGADMDWS